MAATKKPAAAAAAPPPPAKLSKDLGRQVADMVTELDDTLLDLMGALEDRPPVALLRSLAVELTRIQAVLEIHIERLGGHSRDVRKAVVARVKDERLKRRAAATHAISRSESLLNPQKGQWSAGSGDDDQDTDDE
jgi:hypothetical protein